MEAIVYILMAGLVVATIATTVHYWMARRARVMLKKWAEENGYEVGSAEYRAFRKGPYFMKSSNNQAVLKIIVADEDGNVKSGWVCCGSWLGGVLVDKINVTWDDKPAIDLERGS